MLALPPAILDLLNLKAGNTVAVQVDGHRLVIESKPKPHYTLDELLAQCDAKGKIIKEEREWLDTKPVGRELL
jgi:antitoxin ChpS